MTDTPTADPLPPRTARRHKRAAQDRARALSPVRFVLRLSAVPGLALVVALSLYIRTSPYEPEQALRHLIARTGCDSARTVGLAPARRGGPGYHARLDAEDDGISCNAVAPPTLATQAESGETRFVGGAKFVRP